MHPTRTARTHDHGGGGPSPVHIDWSAALREHGRWLRLVVLARLGEPQAVDEVMQEVALAAVRAESPPSEPGRLPAWLHRVAVRQTLLHRRRHGRFRRLLDRHAARQPTLNDPDPLDWLLQTERHALVRQALQTLPPREAEILLGKYAEGATATELAQRLGTTVAAVESRLHRARARLREELLRLDAHEPLSSPQILS